MRDRERAFTFELNSFECILAMDLKNTQLKGNSDVISRQMCVSGRFPAVFDRDNPNASF